MSAMPATPKAIRLTLKDGTTVEALSVEDAARFYAIVSGEEAPASPKAPSAPKRRTRQGESSTGYPSPYETVIGLLEGADRKVFGLIVKSGQTGILVSELRKAVPDYSAQPGIAPMLSRLAKRVGLKREDFLEIKEEGFTTDESRKRILRYKATIRAAEAAAKIWNT
jgi:hypothetical protein